MSLATRLGIQINHPPGAGRRAPVTPGPEQVPVAPPAAVAPSPPPPGPEPPKPEPLGAPPPEPEPPNPEPPGPPPPKLEPPPLGPPPSVADEPWAGGGLEDSRLPSRMLPALTIAAAALAGLIVVLRRRR